MFLEKIITDERGIKMGKAFVKSATPREIKTEENLRKTVSSIIQDVIQNKDQAVLKYNQKFDNNSREMFRVTKEEIQNAYKKVSASLIEDMKVAHQNIEKFAKAQLETINQPLETEVIPGAFLGHKKIPVESVCCYVPGGYYPLFFNGFNASYTSQSCWCQTNYRLLSPRKWHYIDSSFYIGCTRFSRCR